MVYIYFDGGMITLDDGIKVGAAGAYMQRREKVYQFSKIVDASKEMDVPTAEYHGLIGALKVYLKMVAQGVVDANEEVVIRGDSRVIVNAVNRTYTTEKGMHSGYPHLRPLAIQAKDLMARIKRKRLEWVPRTENKRADALCNRALGEYRKQHGIKLSSANRKGHSFLKKPVPVERKRPTYHIEKPWEKMARELGYKGSYRGDPRCGNYIPEKFRPLFGDIIDLWNNLPPGCTCGLCNIQNHESTTQTSTVPNRAGLGAKPLPALTRRATLDEEW